ncbi:hypothetical protein M419DRAFT_141527 [Trichoderma reesei RUT C-30]|uniref:PHD-type domain-containing protein n=1 Tax=Hypocrea jecorina (strain ATCC 56765 / BCRC 32924 / NRRL 11460 / Rut C-30) TaxID=1344414 RepID=A0A024S7W8_HYPJR|nr:hypothetical protein M419DRAFT_141527 [Trichoderma reesei RUT C-30]
MLLTSGSLPSSTLWFRPPLDTSSIKACPPCEHSKACLPSAPSASLANLVSLTPHSSSFGDIPNAHPPPTPKQTPTSGAFPSPLFETPKPPQGSFADASGLTPRFAEEYSVFNATPGNLRGAQFPFADLVPATPFAPSYLGHKRLLSVEELAVEIATRANIPPSNPSLPPPPVDPSRRLPSSPAALILSTKAAAASSDAHLGPAFSSSRAKSPKKLRRGTIEGSDAAQPLSPPPSAHKGGHKLAPKVNMQDDRGYGHPDFGDGFQGHHDMAAMMGGPDDMFVYPLSAPPSTANFWDPAMGMDLDFSSAGAAFFQPSHRHTGSFDWNSDIQLFQDPVPPPPPPSSNQENVQPNAPNMQHQPLRRERMLAPKPPVTGQSAAASVTGSGMFQAPMDDSFGLGTPMEGVDPGLIYSRPPTSSMNADDFNPAVNATSANVGAAAEANNSRIMAQPRRTNSLKEIKRGKMPDRTFTSSPVKAMGRPELNRSVSDTRGKKANGRGALPTLAPASRPTSQAGNAANNANADAGKAAAAARSSGSGRMSPLKSQRRLSSLASIPESASQPQLHRPRTSVRFTIDAHGRARAETTVLVEEVGSITRSRSSRELSASRRSWESSDDDSSTDEEPIIIPSRTNSFNASFALPDPRKPVGSIFHSGRRSISDRSRSASTPSLVTPTEGDSDPETIMADHPERGGDAASELRKVVEDRQKRSMQMDNVRPQQRVLGPSSSGNFQASCISPPISMADSSYRMDGHRIRCVCRRNEADEENGYMLQCESCEMWLHGKCVNINRRTMPSVYICGYCANTPTVAARRAQQQHSGRASNGGHSTLSSLANKTLRTLR